MSKLYFIVLALLTSLLFSNSKYAVIVGNSDYSNIKPLDIVKKDALDISNKFREIGFQVSTLNNASSEEVEDFLTNFKYGVEEGATLLFYYIGHGANIESSEYLLTGEVKEGSFNRDSIPLSHVTSKLYSTKAETILIFIDSYRNNIFSDYDSRSLKVVTKDSVTKNNRKKKLGFIFSTNSGEATYDSIDKYSNSPFTTAFLRNISIPNENLVSILERVSKDVGLITKGTQRVTPKLDFKESIVLNESKDNSLVVSDSYNSLTVEGIGFIRIIAKDDCIISLDKINESIKAGEEKEIEYRIGDYVIKLAGKYKTEELNLSIKEGATVHLTFEDYDYGDDEGNAETITESEYNFLDFNNQMVFVPAKMELDGDYMVSRVEITQKIFEKVMGYNPSINKGDHFPVDKTSIYEAVVFCNRLSKELGLTSCYSYDDSTPNKIKVDRLANGFRLPTLEENRFLLNHNLDDIDSEAWYFRNSSKDNISGDRIFIEPLPEWSINNVAMKDPNRLELYDMLGNVSELCLDFNSEAYISGGNVESNESELMSSYPVRLNTSYKYMGFRVLRRIYE